MFTLMLKSPSLYSKYPANLKKAISKLKYFESKIKHIHLSTIQDVMTFLSTPLVLHTSNTTQSTLAKDMSIKHKY